MKYVKAFACVFLCCLMLTGCSFRLSSSIEDLIAPISPFGENADVQGALNSYVKNGYSLKTPSGGEYITSYTFYDIDNDDKDEAFAFYEPSDDLGTINMVLIDNVDDKWVVVDEIKGNGKDIYSIDFDDLDGDKKDEICICWDAISNSSNHILNIYRVKKDKNSLKLNTIKDEKNLNNYIFVDFDGDDVDEILSFQVSGTASVLAELYSLNNNSFNLLGETKLDSHITSYDKLQIEHAEDDVRVYADAIGSDGSSMLTEIIYWSNSYDTIVSPFYSYSTGLTVDTRRSMMLDSRDLNDDGLIEIPTDYNISKLPKSVKAVDWMIYKNTTLVHAEYSLSVEADNYIVLLPSKVIKSIDVKYDNKKRLMTVLNHKTKKQIFSITPVLKATYDKSKYEGYSIVLDDSGYYYLAKLGDDKDIKITIDDLKNYVKSID